MRVNRHPAVRPRFIELVPPETIFRARRKRPENKAAPTLSSHKAGMANMQFIMNLIWDFSRSSSMAALSQEMHR
jgi:hypothetical protein